jgi:hypothetical protein
MNVEYWEDKADVYISNLIKLRRNDEIIQSKRESKKVKKK